jgi:hypothetical protein
MALDVRDQGQKSKGAGCAEMFDAVCKLGLEGGRRMEVLELRRGSNGYLRETEVSNVIQVSFFWSRRARERQLDLNGAKYAQLWS